MCGIALSRLAADDTHPTAGSDLYERLLGAWSVQSEWYEGDETQTGRGEWYFERTIGGRGVQDVLFATDSEPDGYGTSIRTFDAESGDWHVVWMLPESREFVALIGRSDGRDGIVHTGRSLRPDTDDHLRWSFVDITPSTFTWLGEKSTDGGATWDLVQKMEGTRINDDGQLS